LEDVKRDGVKFANELFFQFVGEKARNVKLGHGSFITIDFGKETIVEVLMNKGLSRSVRGEWHLWVMMSAWRLNQNKEPILGSGDEKDVVNQKLPILEGKKFISGKIINSSFDCHFEFEGNISLNLFSFYIADSRQWMLFTPQKKTFIAGPGSTWAFEDS
jgi:hypothetical protein